MRACAFILVCVRACVRTCVCACLNGRMKRKGSREYVSFLFLLLKRINSSFACRHRFNVDWEPTDGGGLPSPQDAAAYASFLDLMATRLRAHGIKLSVDVATWSAIWNLTLIGKTSVDLVMTMSTYTTNFTTFVRLAQAAQALVPAEKLVVGLDCDVDPPLTEAEVAMRFDFLRTSGVRQIAIWRTGIPDLWWPYIKDFAAEERGNRAPLP